MQLKTLNFLLATFFFSLTTTLSAQSNFQKGYIIKLNGDTLHGFIDNRNWKSSPKEINFKSSADEKSIFKPLQIKSFSIGDKYIYVSTPIQYHQRLTKLNTTANYSLIPETTSDTIFLKLIYSGQLNLFHLYNKHDEDVFFIQKGQDSIRELVEYRILRGEALVSVKPYVQTLAKLMDDCSSIFPEISKVEYNKRDLEKLLSLYDKCLPSLANKKFKTDEVKPKIELAALGGITTSNIKFDIPPVSSFLPIGLGNFGWSVRPTLGANINITLPRINKNSSLIVEISNRNMAGKDTGLTIVQGLNTYIYDYEFKFGHIKLNTAFRYTFNPFAKWKLHTTIGFLNGLLYQKELQTRQKSIIFGREYYDTAPFPAGRSYEQGWILGVGFRVNRFETETRIEISNGVSDIAALSTKVRLFNFKCAYYFWSKQFH